MSVLGKVTDEYFGKTEREEDLMRPPRIDPKHSTRPLTPNEHLFLSLLAKHIVFFDRSLFFQIDDLRRHTELVLSGARNIRSEFSNPDELKREIEELKKLIEELRQEDWELRRLLEGQLGKLKEALTLGEYGVKATVLLGEYMHNNGYDSEVILYVNNIEDCAGNDPAKTKYLMGQVLLHEYFHSFYYHVGIGIRNPMKCVEEPMAEYGSLVALDNVKTSRLPIAIEAGKALTYTYSIVKSKQKSMGHTAAYGFGAYLYDNHKDDYHELIADYANVSRLLDAHSKKALKYKYMVYPKYPASYETVAYQKLRELLATKMVARRWAGVPPTGKTSKVPTVPTRASVTGGYKVVRHTKRKFFALEVFRYLRDHGYWSKLPFVHNTKGKNRKTITDGTTFTLSDVFWGDPIPDAKRVFMDELFSIDGGDYYLSNQWRDDGNYTRRYQIDDLAKMLINVYDGKFDIDKQVNVKGETEYVLIEHP